jgi:hypothetical protein
MPAYTRTTYDGQLLVTFHRDDEVAEQQHAPDGQRAVSIAMRMLALRERLQPGDKLTVEHYISPESVPDLSS